MAQGEALFKSLQLVEQRGNLAHDLVNDVLKVGVFREVFADAFHEGEQAIGVLGRVLLYLEPLGLVG